jgi:protein TonB
MSDVRWKNRLRTAAVVAALCVFAAALVFGLKSCVGSEKRTVPAEMVLQVVPTPPPPPPPPPPPEPEPDDEPEPEQEDMPEPAPADAPVADAPAGDDAFAGTGEGGMVVAGGGGGTGFGRPQDYLRQEVEKCLRKAGALQRARITPQRFAVTVGADRRIAAVERMTSTGREDVDRLLEEKVGECTRVMPPDSRYVAGSRFAIEIRNQ